MRTHRRPPGRRLSHDEREALLGRAQATLDSNWSWEASVASRALYSPVELGRRLRPDRALWFERRWAMQDLEYLFRGPVGERHAPSHLDHGDDGASLLLTRTRTAWR